MVRTILNSPPALDAFISSRASHTYGDRILDFEHLAYGATVLLHVCALPRAERFSVALVLSNFPHELAAVRPLIF